MSSRRFEFRVAGLLSGPARGAFPDLKVEDVPPETVLYGSIVDDAQLHGVMALLQDLGLQIVSLHEIPD